MQTEEPKPEKNMMMLLLINRVGSQAEERKDVMVQNLVETLG
jgi:hypothetical protein